MSRKLFITSDISVDERLASVAEASSEAGLLWPWLLTALDDWGRSTAEPKRLKYTVFPAFASVTPQTIADALEMFAQAGLITLYEVEGKPYLAVPSETWFKYQTHIRTEKRECDRSRIPAPVSASVASNAPTLHSAQVREDTRECAQVRAGVVNCEPSPSPSPSPLPSPTSTADEQEMIEKENVREVCADEVCAAPLAADAALSLTAPTATTSLSPQSPPKRSQSATKRKPASRPAKVTPLRVPGARVHDPVWDACIASMGAAPSNSVERGKWAKGIKALKESLAPPRADGSPGPEITSEVAEEIGVRARRYRMRYGVSVPLNPMALAGNWSQLAHDIPTQTAQQEGYRYGHAAGHNGQFTRQAASGRSSGYNGQRRGTGKPAIGTTEYYAQALLAQQQSQQQQSQQRATHAGQADWGGDGRGRAGEDQRAAALGIAGIAGIG